VTAQRSAAAPKWPVRATVKKYRSCLRETIGDK
jgi:hypothetical protein